MNLVASPWSFCNMGHREFLVEISTSVMYVLQAFKARETRDDHLVNAKNNAICQSASEVCCLSVRH